MPLDYRRWLQILFPLSDDERSLQDLSPEAFVALATTQYQPKYVALAQFQTQEIRAAIHLVKYHHHKQAVTLLAALLTHFLSGFDTKDSILLPVPLSAARQRERGYNQVTVVAEKTGYPISNSVIVRSRHTVPQTSLRRRERLANVKDAFTIAHPKKAKAIIRNKHIFLLDDVATTGATLQAAKASLLPLQPKAITCLAFAH